MTMPIRAADLPRVEADGPPDAAAVARRDAALVARIRSGDPSAFEGLFRAYYAALWAYVLGYVKAGDVAEELVQDVFARIWERRSTWQVRDDVRGYLFGAARNHALRYLGHQRVIDRWEAQAVHDLGIAGVGRGPLPTDEPLRSKEVLDALQRALARLPARQREAYLLRWQNGLANAEIAEAMGISVKGVEVLLAKALRALRLALDRFL